MSFLNSCCHATLSQTEGEDFATNFELADNVYVKAQIKQPEVVYLWLGVRAVSAVALAESPLARAQANVMLEYSCQEAKELLETNLSTAREQLARLDTDLDYLKDQITVNEVNIARVHNHRVKLKQEATAATAAAASASAAVAKQ